MEVSSQHYFFCFLSFILEHRRFGGKFHCKRDSIVVYQCISHCETAFVAIMFGSGKIISCESKVSVAMGRSKNFPHPPVEGLIPTGLESRQHGFRKVQNSILAIPIGCLEKSSLSDGSLLDKRMIDSCRS